MSPASCARDLPAVKLAAIAALPVSNDRPRLRSITGAGLFAYYTAAISFHRLSGDSAEQAAPAALCALLAATIV